ncbi:hypothetical protein B0A52_06144 [Exophiala mesophila]|uniref:Methyltransferase domain-containing protein n=1 Tax=Exophiala mesophila TaxID=212818 RepID=A0A438N5H4_EXOME|nr:hypothetical protein B0A52_06144 [Exophiala mesophila]
MSTTKDWNATQYLKFDRERTRPSRDLLAQVPSLPTIPGRPAHIVDLGCGPGNSTAVIVEQYPDSKITGMDSSPDMIAKAKLALPAHEFILSDLQTYHPPSSQPVDLFFSNAVFQWLPHSDRLPVITRLLQTQSPGGVFAFQVPDNFTEPSHAAMREIAAQGPWAEKLESLRPALDALQSPQEIYDELAPMCSSVDIWHTHYQHVLESHEAIVEWVKGTGLRPFIDPLDEGQREEFLKRYLEKLKGMYSVRTDGRVLLRYPRLFVVAVRK